MKQLFQVLSQRRVGLLRLFAAPAGSSDPARRGNLTLKFFDASPDCVAGHPGGIRHDRDSTEPDRMGFRTRHQATSLLIEIRAEKFKPPPDRLDVYHYL